MRRVLLGSAIPVAALLAWWTGGGLPAVADTAGLAEAIAVSAHRALRGFALGALAGTVLGLIAARSRIVGELLTPSVRVLRAVPSVAWFPVVLVLVGVGEVATGAVIALAVALPVFAGVSSSRGEVVPVFSGLRQGLAQSWLILVAAELVTAPTGIGQLLAGSGGAGRVDRMLVAVAVIGLLALVSELLLGVAERLVRRVTADAGTVIQNTDHL